MPRDGTENLIPMSERSKEEVKKIASKGGKNSGKTRRKKKLLKEILETLLTMENQDGMKRKVAISLALINTAERGGSEGNKAYEIIRDTLGQKPVEQVQNITPPTFNFERHDKSADEQHNDY